MAGNGSRFFEAGYDKLKPLIDIKGKPMFVRVLDNILYGTDIHIIIRKDHVDEYKLDQLIREACPEAKIYVLDKPTEGAACTVMHAIDIAPITPGQWSCETAPAETTNGHCPALSGVLFE